ncbi:MAG: TetR/AcrR family transcriptional regulator [Chloroflexi bacterium]|nr:MAG: TetR/AcrR family transcriptional regulator [Chloroflexota bacterium]
MRHPIFDVELRGSHVKHRAILAAAADVFLREGYAGASIDAIAGTAGVSKRTIYNHFEDKEHLFLAVVRNTLASVEAEFDEALGDAILESDDLERDFVELARRWVRLFLREDASALRRLVIAEAQRHPGIMLGWAEAGPLRSRTRLVRTLAALSERGRLDVPDPERAAEQLALLVTNPAYNRSLLGTIELSDAEVDDIVIPNVRMFLRAHRPGA